MSTKGGFLNFNMQNSFVFYDSLYAAIQMLDSDSDKLKVYDMSCKYNLYDIEPTNLSTELKIIWALIKPQFDANKKKRRNGALGGRPETNKKEEITIGYLENNHRLQDDKPNVNVNVNVNENANVDDIIVGSKKSSTSPPHLQIYSIEHLEVSECRKRYDESYQVSKEQICIKSMGLIKITQIEKLQNSFDSFLISQGITHKTLPDYAKHFGNWVSKKSKDEIKTIVNQKVIDPNKPIESDYDRIMRERNKA